MGATTQVIILCGGENSRWSGYGGYRRKHFLEIEDEALINRTLRMVTRHMAGKASRVHVVVNRGDEGYYAQSMAIDAAIFAIVPPGAEHTEAYKYSSSRPLWNDAGRTVILLGDVWYSEDAMTAILDTRRRDWTAFGRPSESAHTQKPYGELFAQAFWSSDEHGRRLQELDQLYRSGSCVRPAAGWAHYQLMTGNDPDCHCVGKRFVEIDDFTDDFDVGTDYEIWTRAREYFRLTGELASRVLAS